MYEDFERANPLDAWTVVEGGLSTVAVTINAAFPDRGSYGLAVNVVGTELAYIEKTDCFSLSPGESKYVGLWFNRLTTGAASSFALLYFHNSFTSVARLIPRSAPPGWFQMRAYNDASGQQVTGLSTMNIVDDRWQWVVVQLKRASSAVAADGGVSLWVDGAFIEQNFAVDNYDRMDGSISLRAGHSFLEGGDGLAFSIDELMVADEYPQPYVPAATTNFPAEASRCAILYRPTDWESVKAADYAPGFLGIPRSNLIPLPNATSTETLANYATFETEVEDDLNAWLALNTDAAAQITTFLPGHNVPQFFMDGSKFSTISRLMNLGNARSAQTANPLYQQSGRVTVSDLRAQNMYCAISLDGPGFADVQSVLVDGLAFNATGRLAATEKLAIGEFGTLHTSLPVQRTRMEVDSAAPFDDYKGAFGNITTASHTPMGGGFVFEVSNGTTSLRSAANADWVTKVLSDHCASGLAYSGLDEFDGEAFFDCFHAGGSLAEAIIVASSRVDSTQAALGIPNLQVDFPLGGYDICFGEGGPEAIDWSSPIAYLSPTEVQVQLNLTLTANAKYVTGVRPISSAGIAADTGTAFTYFEVDGNGLLQPAPLGRPTDVTAQVLGDGEVLVAFSCHALGGMIAPASYEILTDGGTGTIDLDTPVATVLPTYASQREFDATFSHGSLPALYAVRGRKDTQPGPLSAIVTVIPAATPSLPPVL